jgi:hypothetical protein
VLVSDVMRSFRDPRGLLAERLVEPAPAHAALLVAITPLAAIRPVAVLLRSLVEGAPLPGVVLGLGSFALQIGTWLGLALVLPALARQFEAEIDDKRAFALVTYASLPLWVAGVLFLIPEDPALVWVWSRLLAALVAAWGLVIMHRGLVQLGVRDEARMPLVGGFGVAALVLYLVLFVVFGITSHVVLFVLS